MVQRGGGGLPRAPEGTRLPLAVGPGQRNPRTAALWSETALFGGRSKTASEAKKYPREIRDRGSRWGTACVMFHDFSCAYLFRNPVKAG